jgi:SAM-dependent methyltransferase
VKGSTIEDTNQAAARHFQDSAAAWVDRYRPGHGLSRRFFIRRQAVAWQLEQLPALERQRALDVGCGTGPLLPVLARFAREVVGVDIAPAMIEEARINLPAIGDRTFDLVVASVFDMPFPDAHFDVGVCVGVLEYFDDPLAALRAIVRVMKPGASLVLTVPNRWGILRLSGLPRTVTLLAPPRWKMKVGAVLDRVRGRKPDPSRYYLGASFSVARLRRLCRDADLELAQVTTSGYDGLRLFGLPIPARLEGAIERRGEQRRHRAPWKHLGNNVIVTLRRPGAR